MNTPKKQQANLKVVALAVAAACLSLPLASNAAIDNDLLELLLKKGILTQEEYDAQKEKAENKEFILKRLSDNDDKRKKAEEKAVKDKEANSFEFYGILDVMLGSVQHGFTPSASFPGSVNPLSVISKSDPYRNVSGMFNGGMQSSRWGLRGSRELGSGVRGFFTLESGFNLPTGQINNGLTELQANGSTKNAMSSNTSLNGQLFGRQAFVGLSDQEYGSIAFGRQYNQIYDVFTTYDPVHKSDLLSPFGFSGTLGGGGGVSESSRLDNSIKYKNKAGSINYGALYAIGGVEGIKDANSGYNLNIGYEEGRVGVQFVYENMKNVIKTDKNSNSSGSITSFNTVAVTNYDTEAYLLAGKYQLTDALTVKGGYEHYILKKPSTALSVAALPTYFGIPVGAASGYSHDNQSVGIPYVGGDYKFSPKLNLAAGYYQQNIGAISDQNRPSGTVRTVSLLADYFFDKQTDVYAGLMWSAYSGQQGSLASGNYVKSNAIYGAGLRYKF